MDETETENIVTCMSVTIDGFWIDDQITGLFDTARVIEVVMV
jgi:hypothetical protein